METINKQWRPNKKSSNALLKSGYSQEQLNRIGKVFIQRYFNKLVDSPSSEFSNMVRKSESGHNIKEPVDTGELEAVLELTSHQSDDSNTLCQEVIKGDDSNSMKLKMAQMVINRWGTDREVANEIFGVA